jgi:NAD(P)-dependent dehydrogenase (short-subunit alcohol dehydrogenase family)
MNLGLQGKMAVASGSTAGIGLAIATALAVEGATVVVNGRTEARVAEALEKIRNRVSGQLVWRCRRSRHCYRG